MNKKVRNHLLNIVFVLALLGLTVFILLKKQQRTFVERRARVFRRLQTRLYRSRRVLHAGISACRSVQPEKHRGEIRLQNKIRFRVRVFFGRRVLFRAYAFRHGGQPASAYYMVKDGIDAVHNVYSRIHLLGYTAAIFVLGVAAFLISLFTSAGGWVFFSFGTLSKVFIVIGVAMQAFLIWLFVACLKHPGAVLKTGGALIKLLAKLRLSKKPEALREKLSAMVEKYRSCGAQIKKHKSLFLQTLLFNVLQRGAQVLITAFVFKAAVPETDMLHVFALQCFVLLGYNSMPLPGGSGIFELLYLNVFSTVALFDKPFLVVAVMVTRVISYYGCMIFSGAVTLVYHVLQNGGKSDTRRRWKALPKSSPRHSPEFQKKA